MPNFKNINEVNEVFDKATAELIQAETIRAQTMRALFTVFTTDVKYKDTDGSEKVFTKADFDALVRAEEGKANPLPENASPEEKDTWNKRNQFYAKAQVCEKLFQEGTRTLNEVIRYPGSAEDFMIWYCLTNGVTHDQLYELGANPESQQSKALIAKLEGMKQDYHDLVCSNNPKKLCDFQMKAFKGLKSRCEPLFAKSDTVQGFQENWKKMMFWVGAGGIVQQSLMDTYGNQTETQEELTNLLNAEIGKLWKGQSLRTVAPVCAWPQSIGTAFSGGGITPGADVKKFKYQEWNKARFEISKAVLGFRTLKDVQTAKFMQTGKTNGFFSMETAKIASIAEGEPSVDLPNTEVGEKLLFSHRRFLAGDPLGVPVSNSEEALNWDENAVNTSMGLSVLLGQIPYYNTDEFHEFCFDSDAIYKDDNDDEVKLSPTGLAEVLETHLKNHKSLTGYQLAAFLSTPELFGEKEQKIFQQFMEKNDALRISDTSKLMQGVLGTISRSRYGVEPQDYIAGVTVIKSTCGAAFQRQEKAIREGKTTEQLNPDVINAILDELRGTLKGVDVTVGSSAQFKKMAAAFRRVDAMSKNVEGHEAEFRTELQKLAEASSTYIAAKNQDRNKDRFTNKGQIRLNLAKRMEAFAKGAAEGMELTGNALAEYRQKQLEMEQQNQVQLNENVREAIEQHGAELAQVPAVQPINAQEPEQEPVNDEAPDDRQVNAPGQEPVNAEGQDGQQVDAQQGENGNDPQEENVQQEPRNPYEVAAEIADQLAKGEVLRIDQILFAAKDLWTFESALDDVIRDLSRREGDASFEQKKNDRLYDLNDRLTSARTRQRTTVRELINENAEPGMLKDPTDEQLIADYLARETVKYMKSGQELPDEYKAWCNEHTDEMIRFLQLAKKELANQRINPFVNIQVSHYNTDYQKTQRYINYAIKQYQKLGNPEKDRPEEPQPELSDFEKDAEKIAGQLARGEALSLGMILPCSANRAGVKKAVDRAIEKICGNAEKPEFTEEELAQLERLNEVNTGKALLPEEYRKNKDKNRIYFDYVLKRVGNDIYDGRKLSDEYEKWIDEHLHLMAEPLDKFRKSLPEDYHKDKIKDFASGHERLRQACAQYQTTLERAKKYVLAEMGKKKQADVAGADTVVNAEEAKWAESHKKLIEKVRKEVRKEEEKHALRDKYIDLILRFGDHERKLSPDEEKWISENMELMPKALEYAKGRLELRKKDPGQNPKSVDAFIQRMERNWNDYAKSVKAPEKGEAPLKRSGSEQKVKAESAPQKEAPKPQTPEEHMNEMLKNLRIFAAAAATDLENIARNGRALGDKQNCMARILLYRAALKMSEKDGAKAPIFTVTKDNPGNVKVLDSLVKSSKTFENLAAMEVYSLVSMLNTPQMETCVNNLMKELANPIEKMSKGIPVKIEEKKVNDRKFADAKKLGNNNNAMDNMEVTVNLL